VNATYSLWIQSLQTRQAFLAYGQGSSQNGFAANLRATRKERGLSQEELADMAGLHRTYVGSFERGGRNVSIDNIERLSQASELDIVDLLKP
jgi:DNA-binding XRE family transcriptional regulator